MATEREITRSLDRALDILEALAAHGPSALWQVQAYTGLPKSTTKRLLEAMVRRKFVRCGLSDGNFRINVTIPRRGDATHASHVAQLVHTAAPLMVELTRKIGWPADLHIFHDGRMQIIETTHALSPFDPGKQHIYDLELNVFAAASGIAYLSTLSDGQIAALVEAQSSSERFSLRTYRISRTRLFKEIERARKTGFGRRLVGQTGAVKFDAVAAPIRTGVNAIGAISVWWAKSFKSQTEFLELYGDAISASAQLISARSIDLGE